jgi:hypothetical protein
MQFGFVFESGGSHYVAQAGFELLGSSDRPASASQLSSWDYVCVPPRLDS